MNIDESLSKFGLEPGGEHLPEIRSLLKEQVDTEHREQGLGDTELIKLYCIQIFSAGRIPDIELIWHAKTASMDADASVDIQLLCGAGLGPTKNHLQSIDQPWAKNALARITECERLGDFEGFEVTEQMIFYRDYFSEE